MSKEFDGNDGWMNGPDGEIESGSNQNQPYFPPRDERDQEIPHDMYGDEDPSDDINLFSDDIDEEAYIDELDSDQDNVIGINDIKGTSSARRAARPRHPSAWKGQSRGDAELDTGKPPYHMPAEKPLSDDEKDINRKGIIAARQALENSKKTNVIPLKPRRPKR